ncbi:MAG: class B sortase [Eubacteriales bacterium]|nr:class B sortase [Eubacteriales bacterium]
MKKKASIWNVLAVIAVLVIVFCGWKLYGIYADYQVAAEEYEQLRQIGRTDGSGTVTAADNEEDGGGIPAPGEIDFGALQNINPDIVGWIQFVDADIPIDYPIVHSADNSDYLRRNIYKKYSRSGSIILESQNAADFQDLHTILYGHNMLDRSMFSTLKKYQKQSFYQEHSPYFYIYTPGHVYLYEIFACHDVDSTSALYTVGFEAGAEWQSFIQHNMRDTALYETGVEIAEGNYVMTLSTCTDDAGDRFVVHAKRIREALQQ